jgi:hypothetical protein
MTLLACVLLAASLTAVLGGCSDFQAKGLTSSSIDTQAANAQAVLTQPTLDAATARAYIAANSPIMQGWFATSTSDYFAYNNIFAKATPEIFVSPTYYGLLQASSEEFKQAPAKLANAPDADVIAVARKEALRYVKIEAAKGGVKSPAQ